MGDDLEEREGTMGREGGDLDFGFGMFWRKKKEGKGVGEREKNYLEEGKGDLERDRTGKGLGGMDR